MTPAFGLVPNQGSSPAVISSMMALVVLEDLRAAFVGIRIVLRRRRAEPAHPLAPRSFRVARVAQAAIHLGSDPRHLGQAERMDLVRGHPGRRIGLDRVLVELIPLRQRPRAIIARRLRAQRFEIGGQRVVCRDHASRHALLHASQERRARRRVHLVRPGSCRAFP